MKLLIKFWGVALLFASTLAVFGCKNPNDSDGTDGEITAVKKSCNQNIDVSKLAAQDFSGKWICIEDLTEYEEGQCIGSVEYFKQTFTVEKQSDGSYKSFNKKGSEVVMSGDFVSEEEAKNYIASHYKELTDIKVKSNKNKIVTISGVHKEDAEAWFPLPLSDKELKNFEKELESYKDAKSNKKMTQFFFCDEDMIYENGTPYYGVVFTMVLYKTK